MICVVIPYFQSQAGVLRRALASIAAQRGCALPVHVVVIDDSSPLPAAVELAGLAPGPYTIEVILQANGGPGAARNRGLEAVPSGTRYVAFLDSDDEWVVDHLARAVAALDLGYDFFFADLYQLDQKVGAFARGGRIHPPDHPTLDCAIPDLHNYSGDMFDQILRGNVIGTPTVVYRQAAYSDVRFLVEFTSAGEDYLFWMTLVAKGARVAFSARIGAICGHGVNVYAGAQWGSEQHLRRVQCELRYRKTIGQLFPLNVSQRQFVAVRLSELRDQFILSAVHMLRHRIAIPARLLRDQLWIDPLTLPLVPWVAIKRALKRT